MKLKTAMSERELEFAIRQLASYTGWLIYHTYDSRHSVAGFPDLVLVRPPVVIFAELKSSNGHLRPQQHEWLNALQGCPAVETHVWRPEDWPRIEAILTRRQGMS